MSMIGPVQSHYHEAVQWLVVVLVVDLWIVVDVQVVYTVSKCSGCHRQETKLTVRPCGETR